MPALAARARFLVIIVAALSCASATQGSITVNGTDDIFAAGQSSVPDFTLGGGTLPELVASGGGQLFQFRATGTIASGADSSQNAIPPDGGYPSAIAVIASPSSSN
jgi:hypothetical protein